MSSAQYHGPDVAPAGSDQDQLYFPCSIAQERFWVLDRLEPGNPALNIAVRWQLDGHVSSDLVERAFQAIIARHEILRTSLVSTDGSLFQLVVPSIPFRIASVDLTTLSGDQPMREAERIGQLEARAPFDLAQAPLLRVTLIRIAEQTSLLLLTVHHTVCDGWSIGIFAREFGEQYDALRAGRGEGAAEIHRIPELVIQYGDYARWHRERIQRGEFEPEVGYWKHQLSGMPYLEVPSDKPHPASAAAGGDIVGLLLDRTLTDALQAASRRQGNTLFVTALAALAILLNRYTGAIDIPIGTQVAGRDEVELEDVIGVFINTVVLRLDLSGNPRLPTLLQRTQDVVQGALDHQNLPMEQLIQILQPRRDITRNPFFSVNFIFQRSFIQNAEHSDFKLIDLPSFSPGGLYDLNFFMVERPEGWRISCEYNSDLFLRETVSHQLQSLRTLFGAIAQHAPEGRIGDLMLLDAAEQHRMAGFAAGPAAHYPRGHMLTRLLEEQAARSPKAIAVTHANKHMTYGQLDKAANRLARYLAREGVVPGTWVGLLLPRRIDMLVALLAVLKAGGVVVPFDPAYPEDQLRQMMKQARLPLILTQALRTDLFASADRVMSLDAAKTAIAREWSIRLDVEIADAQPAYATFTSGSTGARRLVPVSHDALVNLLCALCERPGLDASDILVSTGTIASGMTIIDLLLPLMVGARVVLADASDREDGAALLALLQRTKASVMQARPGVWSRLLDAGWTGQPRLKMLCGGDRLLPGLADRLLATGGALWGLYGVAEAAVWSSVARIAPGMDRAMLGAPIANTQMRVLDRERHPLPVGAVGELYVGPIGNIATGDLARRHDDGTIEYVGRAAGVITRYGFRIEPADIEAEILRHSGVAAVLVAFSQTVDGKRAVEAGSALVAYVVPLGGSTGSETLVDTLRIRLSRALPKYMVPDVITLLPALPRTPDDRIDIAALVTAPEPAGAGTTAGRDGNSLQDVQARLIGLWNTLLGRTDIGPDDDFFDLGGHSLLAARLLAGIQKEFGKTIDFATLFKSPTVHELGALLVHEEMQSGETQIVPVQPAGRRTPVFAIDHSWIYEHLGRQLGDDRPFFAIHGSYAGTPTLQAMAQEQIRILRGQQPQGPYVLLGLCAAGVLAYEIAQQLQDQGEQVPLLIMIDTWSPGYLARQSRMAAQLADWSYRWQIVVSDFRRDGDRGIGSILAFAATRISQFIGKRLRGVRGGVQHDAQTAQLGNGADVDPIALLNAAARTAGQRPFTGQICLFHRDTMPSGRFLDPQLGWGDFAAGGIETHALSGDHFSMFRDPGVSKMAQIIDRMLTEAGV